MKLILKVLVLKEVEEEEEEEEEEEGEREREDGRQLSQMSAETTVCTKLVAEEAKVLMAPEEQLMDEEVSISSVHAHGTFNRKRNSQGISGSPWRSTGE